MEPSPSQPDVVSLKGKFAYSVGHVLNDLSASMWFSYLLVFYHRIVTFTNSQAGYLLLIGQVADALATTFVGFESDRTRTGLFRYGRRKTWHLVGVICVLCSFPFCFNECVGCKHSGLTAQFFYYTMFIIIFQFGWSCSQITHLAMINELTHKEGERVALNSYRYAWTVISNISIYAIASVLFSTNSDGSDNDINPEDANVFRILTIIVVIIGIVSMTIFHVGIKESDLPAEETEHRLQMSISSSGRLKRMTWKSFLREKDFYLCASIWMFTRIILNVTQVFLPLYIIDTIQKLKNSYIGIAPLSSYISGLVASVPMRRLNKHFGKKRTMILGLGFVLAGSILYYFLPNFQSVSALGTMLIIACVLLGIGTSTTNICSFSLASDLIGLNTECGAFVYGIMSFTDKLSNGIIIAIIQNVNPCPPSSTNATCSAYYQYILSTIPIGISIITVIITLFIPKTFGASRHELIVPEIQDESLRKGSVLNPEYDECTPLTA